MDKNLITTLILSLFLTAGICQSKTSTNKPAGKDSKIKVTFVELGSVRCIPCQKMQVVMKSIEKKYGDQVRIDFHDVWTDQGKPFGVKYGIQVIPTQVFLDKEGKEFYRHEGFFPEEEIIQLLKSKGIKD